jgi:hypothetical protein
MALLSEKDLRELEDAKIASQPRLTTKNAKQFGTLQACLHLIEQALEDTYSNSSIDASAFAKSQLKDAKNIVDEIFEDLNGVDYV